MPASLFPAMSVDLKAFPEFCDCPPSTTRILPSVLALFASTFYHHSREGFYDAAYDLADFGNRGRRPPASSTDCLSPRSTHSRSALSGCFVMQILQPSVGILFLIASMDLEPAKDLRARRRRQGKIGREKSLNLPPFLPLNSTSSRRSFIEVVVTMISTETFDLPLFSESLVRSTDRQRFRRCSLPA